MGLRIESTEEVLEDLRRGCASDASKSLAVSMSFTQFVADAKNRYPVVFLEKTLRQKQEIGICSSVSVENNVLAPGSASAACGCKFTRLHECVFVNAYNNRITGISAAAQIDVGCTQGDEGVLVRLGACCKLDHLPDGWDFKKVEPVERTFPQELLQANGWKLDVLCR